MKWPGDKLNSSGLNWQQPVHLPSLESITDHQIKAHFSLDEFSHSLLCSPDNSRIYLCGDFNLPGINWNNQDVIGTTLKTEFSLYEMVSKPTRGSYILDLLFTNDDSTCGPMCDPWHTSLLNQPTQNAIQLESKEAILQFQKADFALFRELISAISWDCCFLHGTIDTHSTHFNDIVLFVAAERSIPKVILGCCKRSSCLSEETLHLVHKKMEL